MKNIFTIVLSLVLAAAIIFGLVLYGKYADTKDALVISKEKMSELNEKIIQLDQETSALNDQIEKNTERFKELENAKKNIEELENMISVKDQGLSEFEEKIHNVESDFEEVRKANEALFTELSSKNAVAMELKEKLEDSLSRITFLEDEIAKGKKEIEGFQDQLSEMRGEKAIVETKMAQLKSTYDTDLMELKSANERVSELENTVRVKDQGLSAFKEKFYDLEKQYEEEKKAKAALETELSYRDATTAELQEKLKSSQSRILYLEDEIAKGKREIERLQLQLSNIKGEKENAEIKIGQLKTTYEKLVSDLKKQIENQEVTIKTFEEKISVTFIDRILFEFGKAKISPNGRKILGKIGNTLKSVQGKQIRVVGHTDDVPISPEYHYKFPSNWELSAARAASVVNYLQNEQGLDPTNLEAVGRSFYEPIASNETSKGRAQNRRVIIIIVPKGD
jgi:chemotaxis protein MotB